MLQPAMDSPKVAPAAITPDLAYTTGQGGRIEVYSSVGNNDGNSDSADWRQVNEFAYLISQVPKGSQLHATVYNSYWDHDDAKLNATTGEWEIFDDSGNLKTTGIFSPTQAFRDQLNLYSTPDERKQYIHVLGNTSTINDALNVSLSGGSSLARLLKGAGVMTLCDHGLGACLANGTSATDELMHAKYSLFEKTKDSTGKLWSDVIWITSANLNGTSGGKKSNLSIAIFGDPAAYDGLLKNVWTPEVTETFTDGFLNAAANGIASTNSDFTFYPSPRGTDFEANYLASVTNTALGGTKTECKAYLVHSLFSTARIGIANGLAALQSDKCDVKLILGDNNLANIADTYFSMSTAVRQIIDKVEFANVHDKTLAVSYTLGGRKYGVTWAGSANFNGTSLRFDELAVRVNNLLVTQAVELQFQRLYLLSRAGASVTPVSELTVSPATGDLAMGTTGILTPQFAPSGASVKQVYWRSSDNSVATVDGTGKVTPVKFGTVTISATSLSGVATGSAELNVIAEGGTTTIPTTGSTTVPKVSITNPPGLSMPRQPSPSHAYTVVVNWSQTEYDITGYVELQYYSTSQHKWVHYANVHVVNGRGTRSQTFTSTRTWRARGYKVTSPGSAVITSAGKYSTWQYVTVRTKATTTTPHLYAPYLVKVGATIPFLFQWKNPYGSKYPNTFKLQYYSGHWVTVDDFTIPSGSTQALFGWTATKTYKWRIVTSSASQPKGKAPRVSNSVTVHIAS